MCRWGGVAGVAPEGCEWILTGLGQEPIGDGRDRHALPKGGGRCCGLVQ